jgi:hypothetical protein
MRRLPTPFSQWHRFRSWLSGTLSPRPSHRGRGINRRGQSLCMFAEVRNSAFWPIRHHSKRAAISSIRSVLNFGF